MSTHILALDQGTTSSRALLFDRSTAVVGCAQREIGKTFPQPGWVQQDPMEILSSVMSTVAEVLSASRIGIRDVVAIGITNQRETTIVWDRHTGAPVHDAIVWQSRQTDDVCKTLIAAGREPLVKARTGLLIDSYFSGPKIRWILDNVAGARERAERGDLLFGTVDSWLIWNLTGGREHVTDTSNASRTLLYDIHACDWSPELLDAMGVPASMLPRVCDSSGIVAHTCPDAFLGAAIPITGVAGDQQAALFGHGCTQPGMVKNTYGTGCFMLMHTGSHAVTSRHGLLTTIAWKIGDRVDYALEGSVFIAGASIKWLRDGMGLLKNASESDALATSLTSNEGVYLVPAFVGLGAPHWKTEPRGAFFGLTMDTRREHLARAALEAMAYQSRDVLDAMQADSGLTLSEIRADGGAIRNDFLAQFQSDMLGVPLLRPRNHEVTARGVALLAGIGVGMWDSVEPERARDAQERFSPSADVDRREALYEGWRRALRATISH